MNATLKLNKEDLLVKLRAHRDKISQNYKERIQEIDDELERRKDTESIAADLANWHKEVAQGLTDGTVTVSNSGKLSGAPVKPSAKRGRTAPGRGQYHHLNGDEDTLNYYRNQYGSQRAQAVDPLDTAIELVELSVGDTVEVDSADYQRLLSSQVRYY